MGFENYKDKQKFYRERAKQEKMFHISKPPLNLNSKEKGVTYIKPKGEKHGNNG